MLSGFFSMDIFSCELNNIWGYRCRLGMLVALVTSNAVWLAIATDIQQESSGARLTATAVGKQPAAACGQQRYG